MNTRRLLIGGWALSLVLLLVLGVVLLRGLVGDRAPIGSLLGTVAGTIATRSDDVILYFATPGAEGLRIERRELPLDEQPESAVRALVEELIEGPRADLIPTIDAQVRLLNVYVVDGLAILDFSPELRSAHPGGSTSELLTIYSLVNTLTENLEVVNTVQLLVEGEEVETLAGNVDTRFPFRHNADWVLPERN